MDNDYQNIKNEFGRICDEQESLYKPEFEEVFVELQKLDYTLTINNPCTTNIALLDEALREAGFETDEAFCYDFKKYNALFVEGKELQAKLLDLLEQHYYQNNTKEIIVEGWRFVPISVIGTQDIIHLVDKKMMDDAKEGKGLFGSPVKPCV